MCAASMKDRKTNEELKRLVGVEPITTVIISGRLRWYEHYIYIIYVVELVFLGKPNIISDIYEEFILTYPINGVLLIIILLL